MTNQSSSAAFRPISRIRQLISCKLCWQIALTVFLAIFVIETVILINSANRYQNEQISQARSTTGQLATSLLNHSRTVSDQQILARLQFLLEQTDVTSGGVWRLLPTGAAQSIGKFGNRQNTAQNVYFNFTESELKAPFRLDVILDGTNIHHNLIQFIRNIIGLTTLITLFVTIVTLILLNNILFKPLVMLRRNILAAASDQQHPGNYLIANPHDNEIGEVEDALNNMFTGQVKHIETIKQQTSQLLQASNKAEELVQARTTELLNMISLLRREINEREKAQRLARSLLRFPNQNPNPVLRVSADGVVKFANAASDKLLEHWSTLSGQPLPDKLADVVTNVLTTRKDVQLKTEFGNNTYTLNFSPSVDNNEVAIYGFNTTRFKKAETRLQVLINQDNLTGLANRGLLLSLLQDALVRDNKTKTKTALLVLGINQFETINIEHGYKTGDQLLQELAARLKSVTDFPVARIGADEFAVVMTSVRNSKYIGSLLNAILGTLEKPVEIEAEMIEPRLHIGVAIAPLDGTNSDAIFEHAYLALHSASDPENRPICFYTAALNQEVQQQNQTEQQLRTAIDNNELVLFFQPKLNLSTNQIDSVEALVRWNHPERGLLPPVEFIPIAELSELIEDIGKWVIQDACRQLSEWQYRFPDVKIAINVTSNEIIRDDFSEMIRDMLEQFQVRPERLEIEVTESLLMKDTDLATKSMQKLTDLGVTLAIDDFGTGYSSLNYLHKLPLHRLKIDKSFVDEITSSKNSGAIAIAIIALGHQLDMEITAEGVENETQLNCLRELNCDEVQGYLISKPLAVPDAESFMQVHEEVWLNSPEIRDTAA